MGQVVLNLFIGKNCYLPVVCTKDKFCINLVKIWSNFVVFFKSYSINEYVGHRDLNIFTKDFSKSKLAAVPSLWM